MGRHGAWPAAVRRTLPANPCARSFDRLGAPAATSATPASPETRDSRLLITGSNFDIIDFSYAPFPICTPQSRDASFRGARQDRMAQVAQTANACQSDGQGTPSLFSRFPRLRQRSSYTVRNYCLASPPKPLLLPRCMSNKKLRDWVQDRHVRSTDNAGKWHQVQGNAEEKHSRKDWPRVIAPILGPAC
ncbi:hypothetical protein CCHR01_10978 [Colletotrichum chrysophilum]|uniref:Uncharacterized protein n=1 Tax=Colletotrichum chrysophilum TaxID=1836956 RepID=A0AAD9EF95_9PEZI|nr:hypothetical protein CCHR01_10978 [Colletotrichum chrysophilum]